MNLPKTVTELMAAQNNFDSTAYARCFTETAEVFDEGKTHRGRKDIERWIADANQRYRATMKPLQYEEKQTESILKAEVSGDFDGSPLVLHYHLVFAGEGIQSLKITG